MSIIKTPHDSTLSYALIYCSTKITNILSNNIGETRVCVVANVINFQFFRLIYVEFLTLQLRDTHES